MFCQWPLEGLFHASSFFDGRLLMLKFVQTSLTLVFNFYLFIFVAVISASVKCSSLSSRLWAFQNNFKGMFGSVYTCF